MKEMKKVQQMGNALTIYLPRKWTESNGVEKGSSVFVSESPDGALSILARKGDDKVVASVQANDVAEGLHHAVSSYICGADEIMIRGRYAFEVATEARNKLSAVELLNESDGHFMLRIITETAHLPQEETILRMFNSSRALYDYVLAILESKAEASLSELETRDDTVDRRHLLLLRQAYQSKNAFEAVSNTRISVSIERVCDHMVEIGQYAASNRGNRGDADAFKETFAMYEKAFRYFSRMEFEFPFFAQKDALLGRLRKQVAASNGNSERSNYLRHCIRIVDYAADICEITCNKIRCTRLAEKDRSAPAVQRSPWVAPKA